jgi:digeranylgeranylglycerophospholipid reductase
MLGSTKIKETRNPDVIVVGGGPAGSFAALQLAKKGISTVVFEEHSHIGVPSHCAGHISIRSLKKMGFYPLPEEGILENTFSAANFYSPYGTKFCLHLNNPVTLAINRTRFDQYLAKEANRIGAIFKTNTKVQSLLFSGGFVKGVGITNSAGCRESRYSKIVIDAEGISSRLIRQASLQPFKPNGLVYAVEAEVDNIIDVEDDRVEVYFGKTYAPGFYGWLIPRKDGSGKLGLATNKGNPLEFLKKLIKKHPVASKQLFKVKINQISYHSITIGGPIKKAFNNGFLAVGDCASQVKPTTGGGVIFGMTCAKIAAEVASMALQKGDVSEHLLKVYQQRCNNLTRLDFAVMLRIRRFLNTLSDVKLDQMLRICGRLGVDKALKNIDEIDFQGKMLLTASRKPPMIAALLYFGLLYLAANP